jgi:hypothetical protein
MSFDMSAGLVKLDLDKVNGVLAVAVAELQESLNRQLADIRDCLSEAHRGGYLAAHPDTPEEDRAGHADANYRRLCNANTARERMVRTAQNLADAIQAHFHANEACKRADCQVIRQLDTSE